MEEDKKMQSKTLFSYYLQIIFAIIIVSLAFFVFHEKNKLFLSLKEYWCIDDPDVIDLWYAWVNGSDLNWQKQFFNDAHNEGKQISKYYFDERFSDHNELMWSLRSVEKNAPWVHKIFIITDKQIPTWIRKDHPKIVFVDQSEIFYPGYHTYDSAAIQRAIPHTPGLSRRFILMDDDFMFMRPVTKNYFFNKKGKPIYYNYLVHYNYTKDMMAPHICYNSSSGYIFNEGIDIVHRMFYRKYGMERFPFYPHIQTPFDVKLISEGLFEFNLDKIKKSKFRMCGDIQMQTFYICYTHAKNEASYARFNYKVSFNENKTREAMKRSVPTFECFNCYVKELFDEYLPKFFPEKSSFEL